MKKKFSTLLMVGALLASSVGAFAQVSTLPIAPQAGVIQPGTSIGDFRNTTGKLYQIHAFSADRSTDLGLLTITKDSLYTTAITSDLPLGATLWCVGVTQNPGGGQTPGFSFENKLNQLKLAINVTDTTEHVKSIPTTGILTNWRFADAVNSTLPTDTVLMSYFTHDSVAVLVQNTNTGSVGVKAFHVVNDANAIKAEGIKFQIWEPAPYVLTAWDFNTVFGTETANGAKDSTALVFTRKPTLSATYFKNPFEDFKLQASYTPDLSFIGAADSTAGYMLLSKSHKAGDIASKPDSGFFLHVDTVYSNVDGTQFPIFHFGDTTGTKASGMNNQYAFRFEYFVNNDSIGIRVLEARFKQPLEPTWAGVAPVNRLADANVVLQDLVAGQNVNILTIAQDRVDRYSNPPAIPANTKPQLLYAGCDFVPPVSQFGTMPTDLYVIRNTQGQYLKVKLDSTLAWVTEENSENVYHMPAYQWFVIKKDENSDSSPVNIYNREFVAGEGGAAFFINDINILKNLTNGMYLDMNLAITENNASTVRVKGLNSGFIPVPAKYRTSPELGYKYLNTRIAGETSSYSFNYYHQFAHDRFLSDQVATPKDTLLHVEKKQTAFVIEVVADTTSGNGRYGYYPAAKIKAIPALNNVVQLRRASYKIFLKDIQGNFLQSNDRPITLNDENKYAIPQYKFFANQAAIRAASVTFYFKTNNTEDYAETHDAAVKTAWDATQMDYHALIDLSSKAPVADAIKAGIVDADNVVRGENLGERRTSAFLIEKFAAPLYRRFDGGTYSGLKEPFGDITNTPLYLRFHRFNAPNEFLSEYSPLAPNQSYRPALEDKTISFLGLYNQREYPEIADTLSYTFYVDTAYVRDNTPMPQYMLAINPYFSPADTIWTITKDSTWNSAGQSWETTSDTTWVARKAYTRGDYVFNAQDSVKKNKISSNNQAGTNIHNEDYVGKNSFSTWNLTRLAFVDGVHMGDTFYVIPKEYNATKKVWEKPANSKITTAYLTALPRINKHYLGVNVHFDPTRNFYNETGSTIINTASTYSFNNGYHKGMVFQFRLLDAVDRRFLIESTSGMGIPDEGMAPDWGGWVRIVNGVPTMHYEDIKAATLDGGADIFDVEPKIYEATSNDPAVAAAKTVVIGDAGQVVIKGASGKKVTMSNILGQTLKAQVLTSDNATIAAPAGIVIVSIEGEPAIKTIVK